MRESSQYPWQRSLRRAVGALALGLLVSAAPSSVWAQTCGNGIVEGGTGCVGDCDGDGNVTVDEIIIMVNIALGMADVSACLAGDRDNSGTVTVDEIVESVNNALNGCPEGGSAGAAEEECDTGGLCVGGANAGTACDAEADCQGDGACFDGPNNLNGCDGDDDCPGGSCKRCRPYGGDGCAANCTNEYEVTYAFVPGVLVGGVMIQPGTSGSVVNGPVIPVVPLPLNGTQVLTFGKIAGGSAPVTIKAEDISINRIPVSTIACACVRGATASTCGGTLFDKNGVLSPNCTPDFTMIQTCPVDLPCAPVHGPGNTGSGFVGCEAGGVDIEVFQDCNGTAGGEPSDPQVLITDSATPVDGNAFVVISAAIGTVVGGCAGGDPAYGPDGQFCTPDDATANRGSPNSIRFTTNAAAGTVLNPADFPGDVLGPFGTTGAPFTCNTSGAAAGSGGGSGAVTGTVSAGGTNLAGVFTSCDQPTINDIVVVNNFVSQ